MNQKANQWPKRSVCNQGSSQQRDCPGIAPGSLFVGRRNRRPNRCGSKDTQRRAPGQEKKHFSASGGDSGVRFRHRAHTVSRCGASFRRSDRIFCQPDRNSCQPSRFSCQPSRKFCRPDRLSRRASLRCSLRDGTTGLAQRGPGRHEKKEPPGFTSKRLGTSCV